MAYTMTQIFRRVLLTENGIREILKHIYLRQGRYIRNVLLGL